MQPTKLKELAREHAERLAIALEPERLKIEAEREIGETEAIISVLGFEEVEKLIGVSRGPDFDIAREIYDATFQETLQEILTAIEER